jgi:murein hydrolase activator
VSPATRACVIVLTAAAFCVALAPRVAVAQRRQQGASVQKKQEELQRLREEIQQVEKRLKESSRRERSTIQRLDDYDKQTALLRRLLARLNDEISDYQSDIEQRRSDLDRAESELHALQHSYARTVVRMYRRGRMHDAELLLSSASMNQMYIRARYLQAYSAREKRDAAEIRARKSAIETQKAMLEDKLRRQQVVKQEKQSEETRLSVKVQEQHGLLEKVRQDKQAYEEQLRRKQEAVRKIERFIADLIERERAKRAAAERKTTPAPKPGGSSRREPEIRDLPNKPFSATTFGRLRGRLPWPVASGAVVGGFGPQTNERLGTVTINPGIDIRVPNGSAVIAVADGVVSMINYIVGFGELVIINHDDGFFTVYAQLSDVSVREGQKVSAGKRIATSGEGFTGPQIHFELWYNDKKQNPISWLAPR